jgi:hypothetical protein
VVYSWRQEHYLYIGFFSEPCDHCVISISGHISFPEDGENFCRSHLESYGNYACIAGGIYVSIRDRLLYGELGVSDFLG